MKPTSTLKLVYRIFNRSEVPLVISDLQDADQPLIYANDSFCELTGYDRNEILGRNCRFLQGEGTDEKDRKRIRQIVNSHSDGEATILNYRADGTEFLNRLILYPLRLKAGDPRFMFASQQPVDLKTSPTAHQTHTDKFASTLSDAAHFLSEAPHNEGDRALSERMSDTDMSKALQQMSQRTLR